jgi:hypothetical protein
VLLLKQNKIVLRGRIWNCIFQWNIKQMELDSSLSEVMDRFLYVCINWFILGEYC